MARPLRIEFPGAWYHVMNRGAGRRAIFTDDKDRSAFLKILDEVVDTYRIEIHSYCLMSNHYHLLIKTPLGNLGRAMRHVNGLYTQRFNRAHRLDGPLFRGRYKAILVDADSYLAQVSRYIHLNPVEAEISKDPGDYPWSSCRYFVGGEKAPRWLQVSTTLELFGKGDRASKLYGDFLIAGVDTTTKEFFAKKRLDPIFGNDAFRKKIEQESGGPADDLEVPDRKYLQKQVSMEEIIKIVGEAFGVAPETILKDGRGRRGDALPRVVGMALCRRPGGYSLGDIAAFLGSGYSAVAVAGRRLAERVRDDKNLAAKVKSIKLGIV